MNWPSKAIIIIIQLCFLLTKKVPVYYITLFMYRLLEFGENCPMCSNPVNIDYLQIVENPKVFLFPEEHD